MEELPAAHPGSWKADKFKDLASLKMSYIAGVTLVLLCFESVPKPTGRAQMINQMQAKTVGQTWSVLHSYMFWGTSAEMWFYKKLRGAQGAVTSPVPVATRPTGSTSGASSRNPPVSFPLVPDLQHRESFHGKAGRKLKRNHRYDPEEPKTPAAGGLGRCWLMDRLQDAGEREKQHVAKSLTRGRSAKTPFLWVAKKAADADSHPGGAESPKGAEEGSQRGCMKQSPYGAVVSRVRASHESSMK